jgi:hypothetical protein
MARSKTSRSSKKPARKRVRYSEQSEPSLLVREGNDLITFKEASEWATKHQGKDVGVSNISYLVQYGRIEKFGSNGTSLVSKAELEKYYHSFNGKRQVAWTQQLGNEVDWNLSFDKFTEAQTTKHVHRLHPYKGKFIPQLVEYFLDGRTDSVKKETYFAKGDIVLDPFCGSGTTLVQCNELGLHSVGIDISEFNALISNVKIEKHNLIALQKAVHSITIGLTEFLTSSHTAEFENRLLNELYRFNNKYFPVPEYKFRLRRGDIDEQKFGKEKEGEFLPIFTNLVREFKIKLRQDSSATFLDRWYSDHVRKEIDLVHNAINHVEDNSTRDILAIILSRTIRSCRATTHADLATLIEPITTTYYCSKHGKMCKPLFSILKWWEYYSKDTILRMGSFDRLRTATNQCCLTGDSRTIDITQALREKNPQLAHLVETKKIQGIFTSPPYVGLIDYHEQHAYAYDLFKYERRDGLEIGRLYHGQGKEARDSYVQGVSDVFNNAKRFLADDYYVFVVANDKFNLYPTIAANAGMKIVHQFRRPVLNRTEKDKGAYSESIFLFREQ